MARNQAVLRAVCGKLNLGVLCALTGAAAFLESSTVLVLGMAAFFGLVAREVYQDGRRLHHYSPRIPDGATFENVAIRLAIDGISAAQKERLEAVRGCSNDVLRLLDDVLRSSVALETAALRLARRTDRLHGYLARKDIACVRDNMYSAQQSAQLARTPNEREIYDAAAQSYALKVEALSAIDLGIRVSIAKLEHIRATLSVVPPRIVKLCATSADMGDNAYVRLSDELRAASHELLEAEERFQMLALGIPDDAPPPAHEARPRRGTGVRVAPALDPLEDVIEAEDTSPRRRGATHAAI